MQIPQQVFHKYNVNNDNVSKNLKNNVIDNVARTRATDLLADTLVARLNNPGAREYYCKVAYKLSEAQIHNNLEKALSGRDPLSYFTWLCNKELPTN